MPEKSSGSEDAAAAAPTKPGDLSNCVRAFDAPINTKFAPEKQALLAADLARRRRLVAKLHALGPPALYHFLTDLERGADLRGSLETYASLPADFIKAYRGDQFPALFAINEEAAPR